MRKTFVILAAILVGSGAVAADRTADRADQAKFEQAVAGLTPGKPIDCLGPRQSGQTSLSAIGSRLLYRASRKLVYVNETAGGCESVARGDALVTRSVGRLCRGDIAETVDYPATIPTGGCALGAFTPYSAR